MSRSYKKSPYWTDGKRGQKPAKRHANKRWRNKNLDYCPRAKKAYKRYFNSYDIHDWISYRSETEAYHIWKWYWQDYYPTYKEYFEKEYAKYYIRK